MIELDLSYKQFCIFNENVKNPFNDWNDANIAQGFSIRKESISVMTLNSDGVLKIFLLSDNTILDNAKRIVEFEYNVVDESISIATISSEFKIQIKKGIYKIRIQLCEESENSELCYLSFLKKEENDILPRYLKSDEEITRVSDFEINSLPA